MKKIIFLLCFMILFSACGGETEEKMSARQIYAMDTVCSVTIYGEEKTADSIAELLVELDGAFSAYDGEVEELNRNGGGEMSESVSELLSDSGTLLFETGTFSPFLGSVTELWGIGSKNYVPTDEEVSKALESAWIYNAEATGNVLTLKNGAKLNFGGVAKGYASDKIREILIRDNVKSAMISLGGNVYVHGKKPDGSLWRVGVRDPKRTENDWVCTLSLENKFIISSGDYERYFERDGKRYHHIIDPNTGYPAESDLLSVTVVSESGVRADGYSTALYVMGSEGALRFWREKKDFELVLICRDGRVIITEGLSETVTENREAGYTYETAHR
ncbi:MAG: FAD:protein FMN transferase [Oscillospiraceae bacterium]|nr:FAD:protein FMN transferase [Oscillospiraceae bacterium]